MKIKAQNLKNLMILTGVLLALLLLLMQTGNARTANNTPGAQLPCKNNLLIQAH